MGLEEYVHNSFEEYEEVDRIDESQILYHWVARSMDERYYTNNGKVFLAVYSIKRYLNPKKTYREIIVPGYVRAKPKRPKKDGDLTKVRTIPEENRKAISRILRRRGLKAPIYFW